MTAAQPGLLKWVNTVRLTMAGDSGRQIFKDQIQQQGFLFLEDYLDNIVAGARQDALIDLVKTPGRKKGNTVMVKPHSVASKPNYVSHSLENDIPEKSPPLPNSLLKTLLVINNTCNGESPPVPHTKQRDYSAEPITGRIPPHNPFSFTASVDSGGLICEQAVSTDNQPSANTQAQPLDTSEQKELSIIVEGDESSDRIELPNKQSTTPDETRKSMPTSQGLETKISASRESTESTSHAASSSSINTFHSIALDSSNSKKVPDTIDSIEITSTLSIVEQPLAFTLQHNDDDLEGTHSPDTELDTFPKPSSAEHNDYDVPVNGESTEGQHDYGLSRKPSIPVYPSLPAPAPLRKSIRAPRDPSVGIPLNLGAATPGVAIGGKRTSWLAKAREVKALEDVGRKTTQLSGNPVGSSSSSMLPALSAGIKRKSGEMRGSHAALRWEEEQRISKASKTTDDDFCLPQSIQREGSVVLPAVAATEGPPTKEPPNSPSRNEDGIFGLFKKTVEGLGLRGGKSLSKSLGGPQAAQALAEARKAAEEKIAERERNFEEKEAATVKHVDASSKLPDSRVHSPPSHNVQLPSEVVDHPADRRLSLSDLVAGPEQFAQTTATRHAAMFEDDVHPTWHSAQTAATRQLSGNDSISTTPPDTPPASRPSSFVAYPVPVFSKPPSVFVRPGPAQKAPSTNAVDRSPQLTSTIFSKPAPKAFGLPATIRPLSPPRVQLSAQSTLESITSEPLFHSQDSPSWMPGTQDTELTQESQPDCVVDARTAPSNLFDDDDSWPMDEKIGATARWNAEVNDKEDSYTWSTLPTNSQRRESRMPVAEQPDAHRVSSSALPSDHAIPGSFDIAADNNTNHDGVVPDSDLRIDDLGVEVLLDPKLAAEGNQSQSWMPVTTSSQGQHYHGGFLGQATKLVNSVLGNSKKGKTEVKSLQLAAVAAKKQHEEQEKKTARLKEMENRRQQALQKKAEDEKAKAIEQERKFKEETERRKREREDHTDKRPLKGVATKKEEDNPKKRKLTVESDKKGELKKPTLKSMKSSTKSMMMKPSLKQPAALASSAVFNASYQPQASTSKIIETKSSKPGILKDKQKAAIVEVDEKQPSQLLQSQMAARAKAQLKAANQQVMIPSESIELPDINSEYSDSDDEDRPRAFDPPDWAQSPELRLALQQQSDINPYDIFGPVQPLRMEEIFRTRTSKFRARTSSANWAGADRLTVEEEQEYERRMGFK